MLSPISRMKKYSPSPSLTGRSMWARLCRHKVYIVAGLLSVAFFTCLLTSDAGVRRRLPGANLVRVLPTMRDPVDQSKLAEEDPTSTLQDTVMDEKDPENYPSVSISMETTTGASVALPPPLFHTERRIPHKTYSVIVEEKNLLWKKTVRENKKPQYTKQDAVAVVILGANSKRDREYEANEERALAAVNFAKDYLGGVSPENIHYFASGYRPGGADDIEAELILKVLLKNKVMNVDGKNITIDRKAQFTVKNFIMLAPEILHFFLNNPNKQGKIVLVTSDYHMCRAKSTAEEFLGDLCVKLYDGLFTNRGMVNPFHTAKPEQIVCVASKTEEWVNKRWVMAPTGQNYSGIFKGEKMDPLVHPHMKGADGNLLRLNKDEPTNNLFNFLLNIERDTGDAEFTNCNLWKKIFLFERIPDIVLKYRKFNNLKWPKKEGYRNGGELVDPEDKISRELLHRLSEITRLKRGIRELEENILELEDKQVKDHLEKSLNEAAKQKLGDNHTDLSNQLEKIFKELTDAENHIATAIDGVVKTKEEFIKASFAKPVEKTRMSSQSVYVVGNVKPLMLHNQKSCPARFGWKVEEVEEVARERGMSRTLPPNLEDIHWNDLDELLIKKDATVESCTE